MHPLVKLAHDTIRAYVTENRRVIDPPQELTEEMKGRAGTFVSIHKHGNLRGCIGTIEPTQKNVALEVIHNAISAATRDPRFPPIAPHELDELEISVDVLLPAEKISDISELDPKRYGVIVEKGYQRGLLLPNLEGVDTPEYQVDIARRKAGLASLDGATLYRFEVTRYH
ncbi:MAG: AmmeMemoRadiSam system protein A [bacterium]